MSQKNSKGGTVYGRLRRINEIAYLYFQGDSIAEMPEDAEVSERTIQRDIEYIEEHREEFLS